MKVESLLQSHGSATLLGRGSGDSMRGEGYGWKLQPFARRERHPRSVDCSSNLSDTVKEEPLLEEATWASGRELS